MYHTCKMEVRLKRLSIPLTFPYENRQQQSIIGVNGTITVRSNIRGAEDLFRLLTLVRTHSLAAALSEFQDSLTPPQKAQLLALSTHSAPDANAVLVFTAEVDRTSQRRKSRCVASRLQNTLQFIQQFSGVVDTFVSADPSTAALAWGGVKVTILVRWTLISPFRRLNC